MVRYSANFFSVSRSDPVAESVIVSLERRPRYRPCADDSGIYEPLWEKIGVNLGYWVELAYSGWLLEKAHKGNPNSSLRRFTLFSEAVSRARSNA